MLILLFFIVVGILASCWAMAGGNRVCQALIVATALLGVGAAVSYANYNSTKTAIEMDCWDDESCAATSKAVK